MSKKIAGGAQAIVLDVKVGKGAFMHSLEDASQLACKMVSIARLAGRKAVALLANMDQPLGQAVGNALEVREAIDTLHGGGPGDFRTHCLQVSAHMLTLGGVSADLAKGVALAESAVQSGSAWEKFRELVIAQGGDVRYVDEPDRLPRAEIIETIPSPRSGFLAGVHAREVGETSVLLGAGRARKGDPIDHAVGIVVHHKVGDRVEAGEPLFTLHANRANRFEEAREKILSAHTWSDEPVDLLPQFHGVIMESDIRI
jgi:pyrimidine-nucleoside phosphorylase